MSDKPKAFPTIPTSAADPGMLLRDWFAGQALPASIAKADAGVTEWDLTALFGKDQSGIRREEIAAALAYRYADAMLARRSRNSFK